jgi:hypothetical protein
MRCFSEDSNNDFHVLQPPAPGDTMILIARFDSSPRGPRRKKTKKCLEASKRGAQLTSSKLSGGFF